MSWASYQPGTSGNEPEIPDLAVELHHAKHVFEVELHLGILYLPDDADPVPGGPAGSGDGRSPPRNWGSFSCPRPPPRQSGARGDVPETGTGPGPSRWGGCRPWSPGPGGDGRAGPGPATGSETNTVRVTFRQSTWGRNPKNTSYPWTRQMTGLPASGAFCVT